MRNIPIAGKGGIGDHCKGLLDELIRETVISIDRKVKLQSPVDTGRFRMSWQVGENTAAGGIAFGPVSPSVVTPVHRPKLFQGKYKEHLPYSQQPPLC